MKHLDDFEASTDDPVDVLEAAETLAAMMAVLDPRERRILEDLMQGCTYTEIAAREGLAASSYVRELIANVRRKARETLK